MDKRMERTRGRIKAAFLELCSKLKPDSIKVTDICSLAKINKTTFYNHYPDFDALANELWDGAVNCVISGFEERDSLFEDPKGYVNGLLRSLERESAQLRLIFKGKQDVLLSKLKNGLCEIYEGKFKDTESYMQVRFVIGGFGELIGNYLFYPAKCEAERAVEYAVLMLGKFSHNGALAE